MVFKKFKIQIIKKKKKKLNFDKTFLKPRESAHKYLAQTQQISKKFCQKLIIYYFFCYLLFYELYSIL